MDANARGESGAQSKQGSGDGGVADGAACAREGSRWERAEGGSERSLPHSCCSVLLTCVLPLAAEAAADAAAATGLFDRSLIGAAAFFPSPLATPAFSSSPSSSSPSSFSSGSISACISELTSANSWSNSQSASASAT